MKVRGSAFLGNAGSSIRIESYINGMTIADTTSGIDLGVSANDPGKNILQAPAGMGPNGATGLCFGVTKNTGQSLAAYRNTFAQGNGFVDCSANPANPALTHNTTCSGGVDVSVLGPAANSNNIIANACTQP